MKDLAIEEKNENIIDECKENIIFLYDKVKQNEIKCFLSNENDSLDCYL